MPNKTNVEILRTILSFVQNFVFMCQSETARAENEICYNHLYNDIKKLAPLTIHKSIKHFLLE